MISRNQREGRYAGHASKHHKRRHGNHKPSRKFALIQIIKRGLNTMIARQRIRKPGWQFP